MDEERIERALRQGPPDERAYSPVVARRVLAEARSSPPRSPVLVGGRGTVRPTVRSGPAAGGFRLVGTLAAGIVFVAAIAFAPRLAVGPGSSPAADLLGRLRAEGSVRIVVTDEAPQTVSAGGSYIGFDVDVAREVAERLGLSDDISAEPSADILAGRGSWDLALPSRAAGVSAAFTATRPYYAWPAWLVVEARSTATSIDDLRGQAVCTVPGTAGADWLAAASAPGVDVAVDAPGDVRQIARAGDEECAAAVSAGEAAAAVTSTVLDDELAARGVRALAEPVLLEHRAMLVRGTGSDVATLVNALNRAIADLEASGRLSELSRGAFGGRDLSPDSP